MHSSSRVGFGLVGVVLLSALGTLVVACEPSSSSSSGAPPASTTFPAPTTTAPPPPTPTMMPMPGSTATPPDGHAWGPAVEISNTPFSNLRGDPHVGIDAAGNAVAVWLEELADNTRNAIWASHYSGGGAWSPPATIDNAIGSASAPQVAMTPSGTAIAAFVQSDSNQGGQVNLVTNRFTGTWATPATLPNMGSNPDHHVLAVGIDGAATLAFQAPDAMFPRAWSARSSATGTWAPATVMGSNVQPGWWPAVTVAPNGEAVMTWTETTGGPSATSLWASRTAGGVWQAPALLTADVGQVLQAIVVGSDAAGNAVALWSQRLAGLYTVRSAYLNAGTATWSAPVTVNDGKHEALAPALGVDADGDAVAVWSETEYGVVANRFTSSTASWSSPVVVQARSTGGVAGTIPRVGVDAKGNAVAAWVSNVGSPPRPQLFAAHLASAGNMWTAPIDLPLADPNATPYASETQLSINAKGEAMLVWHQQTDATAATGIWGRVYR
jgi:hypothetical protein